MNGFVWGLLGVAALFVALFVAQPTLAQNYISTNNNIWFNPELETELVTPSAFDGLYAGISLGLANNNFNTFYTSTVNTYRIPAGVFVGYNRQITPWLLAGVELQGEVAMDWTTAATDFRILGLGRVGYLLADDFVLYQMAGLGLINGRSAYAIGMGLEQSVSKDFAIRAEAIAYGQLSAPASITNYGGFTLMKIAAGAVWHFGDYAQNSTSALPYAGALEVNDFAGPYLGYYIGGMVNMPYNFFIPDPLNGWHLSRFSQGAAAGWNYRLTDWLRAGGELQAGINYNTSGGVGWDTQALARLGVVPADGLMLYGSTGAGILAGRAAYSLGGGVEYAIWGKNTVRLDIQALGEIQPAPPIIAPGFTATKVTVGTLWHLN